MKLLFNIIKSLLLILFIISNNIPNFANAQGYDYHASSSVSTLSLHSKFANNGISKNSITTFIKEMKNAGMKDSDIVQFFNNIALAYPQYQHLLKIFFKFENASITSIRIRPIPTYSLPILDKLPNKNQIGVTIKDDIVFMWLTVDDSVDSMKLSKNPKSRDFLLTQTQTELVKKLKGTGLQILKKMGNTFFITTSLNPRKAKDIQQTLRNALNVHNHMKTYLKQQGLDIQTGIGKGEVAVGRIGQFTHKSNGKSIPYDMWGNNLNMFAKVFKNVPKNTELFIQKNVQQILNIKGLEIQTIENPIYRKQQIQFFGKQRESPPKLSRMSSSRPQLKRQRSSLYTTKTFKGQFTAPELAIDDKTTVMQIDLASSTKLGGELYSTEEYVNIMHEIISIFDNILIKYELNKIAMAGDAYIVSKGNSSNKDNALAITLAAVEMYNEFIQWKTRNLKIYSETAVFKDLTLRMGIYSHNQKAIVYLPQLIKQAGILEETTKKIKTSNIEEILPIHLSKWTKILLNSSHKKLLELGISLPQKGTELKQFVRRNSGSETQNMSTIRKINQFFNTFIGSEKEIELFIKGMNPFIEKIQDDKNYNFENLKTTLIAA
ncbi:adenylate/guanylate cyclase domain-containing protein [bacterium]